MTTQAPYISRPQAEELLQAFATALKYPQQQPIVFHVWGIGGVGKSTLTRKLKETHQTTAQIAEVSFGLTEEIDNPISLMAKLYEQIVSKDAWSDPFWERYELYWQTIHQLTTESASGKGAVGEEQGKQVKQLLRFGINLIGGRFGLEESEKETAKKAIDEGVDTAIAALSLKDSLQQLLQQHRATKRNKSLQELMLQPLPQLTQVFVQGLSQQSKWCPVIFVLDTYEKALPDMDVWLWKSLLGNTDLAKHPVRLVVAGRHCVLRGEGWRKLQQDRHALYEYCIDRFDFDQTKTYLTQAGCQDDAQDIFQVTKGLPYYLNWVREQHLKGQCLDFAQGNREVVRLLQEGLNNTQKYVAQLAACCLFFDRKLIQFLMQQQGINFQTSVDPEHDCFNWLIQQTFVEPVSYFYRLDDVARDVFRLSLWQDDRAQFEQVHDLLARYYKSLSNQEVLPNESPLAKYENPDWRRWRKMFLYYLLFTRRADVQQQFLAHLLEARYLMLEARYLNQDEVVQFPLRAIMCEMELPERSLLRHTTRQFLAQVSPAVEYSSVLAEKLINYAHNQKIDKAIQICLGQIDKLDGLAKFAALFYKSGTLYESRNYAEALVNCDRAIQFNPDENRTWILRGRILAALGRYEEADNSYSRVYYRDSWVFLGNALCKFRCYDEAVRIYNYVLQIEPDDEVTWYFRGLALYRLKRYGEAIESFDKSSESSPHNPDELYMKACCYALQRNVDETIRSLQLLPLGYRDAAKNNSDFDGIREDDRFQSLIDDEA